jgi:hypothetical protein
MRSTAITQTEADEVVMQRYILAFLEEYCRGMTLHDVREWYDDAFPTGLNLP